MKFMGILDTIIHTKQAENLNSFRPKEIVAEILNLLKERDRQILANRYGLLGKEVKTLAAIGLEHGLTRERVRQIEKDLIRNLRKSTLKLDSFAQTKNFLMTVIVEHGRIIAEENLMLHLNIKDQDEKNSIVFQSSFSNANKNFGVALKSFTKDGYETQYGEGISTSSPFSKSNCRVKNKPNFPPLTTKVLLGSKFDPKFLFIQKEAAVFNSSTPDTGGYKVLPSFSAFIAAFTIVL